jgi:DNA-binding transcriptional regulator YiaG
MFNDPCEVCGVRRLDHEPTQIRHRYQSPALPADAFHQCEFWDIVPDSRGGLVERSIMRHAEREANSRYSAPLPSPDDRKRIRERAGLTQQDLADELFVSRWTLARWEKPAGYRNRVRLPGREPVGALREAYSDLLRQLATLESADR